MNKGTNWDPMKKIEGAIKITEQNWLKKEKWDGYHGYVNNIRKIHHPLYKN